MTAAPALSTDRRALLAKLHIARKDLAIEEGSYRALMKRVTGLESAALCSDEQLILALTEMQRLGWSDKPKKGISRQGADMRGQALLLRALWRALWELGEARSADDRALVAFVARQTGIEALRWNSSDDLRQAIECLKQWLRRVGYVPERCRIGGPMEGRYEPGLIRAVWKRLVLTKAVDADYLATWMNGRGWRGSAPEMLQPEDAREVVRELGQWLRHMLAEENRP